MSLVLQSKVEPHFKNRKALSTVVTMLIILVISVLLAATVSYFAINVTGTRMQEESVFLAKQHVWFNNIEGHSQAAILIINIGGRDISVQKVTVRGQTVNWSEAYYFKGKFTLDTDLIYITNLSEGSLTPVRDTFGSYETVNRVHGYLPLCTGESMLVYVKNPDSITINDVGQTVAIDVYTSQAIYYKEANVETPNY